VTEIGIDLETYSDLDLKVAGLDRYSRQAEVMMCAYSFDEGPVKHWQRDDGPFPQILKDALTDPHVVKTAFNGQFERTLIRNSLKLDTPIKGWRCTMALAYLQSFSGTLGEVGSQIGLPEDKQKTKDGRRLIGLFCKPQNVTTKQPHKRRTKATDPWDWSEFCDYNIADVVAEQAVKRRLAPYPYEPIVWLLYAL
jgi:DNA polymerase